MQILKHTSLPTIFISALLGTLILSFLCFDAATFRSPASENSNASRKISSGKDYSLSTSFRLYPQGAILTGTFGYSKLLWDRTSESGTKWKYGYMRPSLTFDTLLIHNELTAKFEFFPVSLLGITMGQGYTSKNYDGDSFDCSEIECQGLTSRSFIQGSLILGLAKFFLVSSLKFELLKHATTKGTFAEEASHLNAGPGIDHKKNFSTALGYSYSDKYSFGFFGNQTVLSSERSEQIQILGFFQNSWGQNSLEEERKWSGIVGAGVFHSALRDSGFTAILGLKWKGEKSLSILD